MKTLNAEGGEQLIKRAKMLQSNLRPLWGTMTVTEMLHHCNKATEAILEGKAGAKRSTIKQKITKFLFLNLIKKFPKNANSPERFNVKKRQLVTGKFDDEFEKFLALIKRFYLHKEDINVSHPYFGKLNTKEWRLFTWLHLDHHLRQFGV